MQKVLTRLEWILQDGFGLDLRRFLKGVVRLPRYLQDLRRFRGVYDGAVSLQPCLHDRFEEGGSAKSEYFWQDLLVARWIHADNPRRHVDIGSRVDGFVAHVASFREIEVFDVRTVTARVPGVVFRQADLMDGDSLRAYVSGDGYCDSLSCLHALEHFGLGRYGDPIQPRGYERGLENMVRLLQPLGRLYLSTPIGAERVEFNANRVFDPLTILQCAQNYGLELQSLTVIEPGGVEPREAPVDDARLREISRASYALGIFRFIKPARSE